MEGLRKRDGKVIANLQYKGQDAYWKITSACEFENWLYCGSVNEPAIARIPLGDVLPDWSPQTTPVHAAASIETAISPE